MDCGHDGPEFGSSRQGKEIFLFSTASRPTSGHAHLPKQSVPGSHPTGAKRQGREADYSPPSSTKVKNGGAIPPLPEKCNLTGA
jgi:hypothetical protein